jgi:hypothetical protein
MNNEQKLLELTAKIHAADSQHGNLYSAKLALGAIRTKIESVAVASLAWQAEQFSPRCDAAAGGDHLETWFNRNGGQDLSRLAMLDAAERALQNHPGMQSATDALQPLVAERDRLQALIESDKAALAAAEDAAIQALAIAKERAALAAENDPQVRAAQAALAALTAKAEPPDIVLTRGKFAVSKAKDSGDNLTGAILADLE